MDFSASIGLTKIDRATTGGDGNPKKIEDDENILQSFDDIKLVVGSLDDQGVGKLFITDGRIFWLSTNDTSLGYTIDFPSISMHAIATDPESVDTPCMYIQLDHDDTLDYEDNSEEEEDNDNNGDLSLISELRLIPLHPDTTTLELLFDVFCQGAERNPDKDLEEEGQGNLFFDQGEVLANAFDQDHLLDDEDEDLVDQEDYEKFEDADVNNTHNGTA